MIGHGSARELLLVEALGDVVKLLDRVDGMVNSLDAARQHVDQAGTRLQAQADGVEKQLTLLTERAKTETVKHIARNADRCAREVVASQTKALQTAVQTLLDEELRSALHRLTQEVEARNARRAVLREWWINIVGGMSVVLLTHALTVYFFGR